MTGFMYILECSDGSYYTGSTVNLNLRMEQHNAGEGANHTRKRLPVQLIYSEEYERIKDAFKREKQIQGWSRKKKEALINGKLEELHFLAECKNVSHYRGFGEVHPEHLDFARCKLSRRAIPERSRRAAQRRRKGRG